jgi:hypothetical protein
MSYDNRGDNRGYRPRQEGKISAVISFYLANFQYIYKGGGNRYRGGGGGGGGPQRFRGI